MRLLFAAKPTRPRACLFCGATPLTKEHVFSDWLSAVFPRGKNMSQMLLTTRIFEGRAFVQPGITNRPQSLLQTKIKLVCGPCNNGWMSSIVSNAKPVVHALASGTSIALSVVEQQQVASWIALTAVIGEYTDIENIAIPATDLAAVHSTHQPPANWTVLIGRYNGTEWATRMYHHLGHNMVNADDGTRAPVLQITTFVLDELIMHAFSSPSPALVQAFRFAQNRNMVTVWPTGDATLWPCTSHLDDIAVERLNNEFHNIVLAALVPPAK
jgi:hypothetical protein